MMKNNVFNFAVSSINEYIRKYDLVQYDTEELNRHHMKAKRGTTENRHDSNIIFNFHALGRYVIKPFL